MDVPVPLGRYPGIDCLPDGHLARGEWQDGRAWASWCAWCGTGITNEDSEPEAWEELRREGKARRGTGTRSSTPRRPGEAAGVGKRCDDQAWWCLSRRRGCPRGGMHRCEILRPGHHGQHYCSRCGLRWR
jgi:hypothetical protein